MDPNGHSTDAVGAMGTRVEGPRPEPSFPKLVFRTGPARGKVFLIEQERIAMGRDQMNDIVLEDDIVSSRHAIIGRDENGALWIRDAGSKNGTYLNGQLLHGTSALRDGDVFCIAQTGPEIQFVMGEPRLPSLLSTCTSRLARTGSLKALGELLPQSGKGAVVSASGVRQLIDHRLEEATRKSRRTSLQTMMGLVTLALLATLVFLSLPGNRAANGDGVMQGGFGSQVTEALPIQIDLDVADIFGSLFRSYRERPIGSVVLTSLSKETLEDLRFDFRLFTHRKGEGEESLLKESFELRIPALAPGAEKRIELTAKLSGAILSRADQEVTARVDIKRAGLVGAGDGVHADRGVTVWAQNVLDWKIAEQIGAFVDAEDAVVRSFANAAWTTAEVTTDAFPPENIVKAITLLTALGERRLRYLDDGRSATTFGGDGAAKDRVKFPGETLLEGTGDCDDLSVLCCSLLQSVNVPTAFVVAPDHVFFMFDSGLGATRVEDTSFDPESVVQWGGRIWIPIESTTIASAVPGFSRAWSDAWKQKASVESGEFVQVIEIETAWKNFRPFRAEADRDLIQSLREKVWFPESTRKKISDAISALREKSLENLTGKIQVIEEDFEGLERDQEIALLYASGGFYVKARDLLGRAVFGSRDAGSRAKILALEGSLSGDQAFLLSDLAITTALAARSVGEYTRAAGCFELALREIPDELDQGRMMLRIAAVYRLSGNLPEVKAWARRALKLDPSLGRAYDNVLRGEGLVAGQSAAMVTWLREGLRVR